MKKIPLLATSALFLGLAALCVWGQKNDSLAFNPKASSMAESLKLSDEELLKVKKDALDGSPSAGDRLVQYYSVYVGDDKQTMYWAQIAAENGGAKNAFNYASFLSDDTGNIMSLTRARFWAKHAIEDGSPVGKNLLSEIDKKIKSSESNGPK
jgi:hypothetical protein